MQRECDHLLSYIANELDHFEHIRYQAHLKQCLECNREYQQLRQVWESMQLDFEEQEVPQSLKADVLHFIDQQGQSVLIRMKQWGIRFKRQFTPLSAAFLVCMVLITGAFAYENLQLKRQQTSEMNRPVEIISAMNLTSVDQSASDAGGSAFVVQQGNERKLVVQVSHFPKLDGTKVYQVWLLKDEKRQNAGIFKPDDRGSGILTYPLSKKQSFDRIGITMEPDAKGTQPRGKKIAGT